MKKNRLAFTLIEIMTGTLIFAIVIIGGFQALGAAGIAKVKLIEETKIEKDAIYFSEKLFSMIKEGGTIDYEEYFNRSVVNLGLPELYQSGHYIKSSGFGNFGVNGDIETDNYGESFYYCLSGEDNNMGTGGCITSHNDTGNNLSGEYQRYGEYSLQFIDYNSNEDDDGGDEDNINGFRGDDDDEYLGLGPKVFDGGTNRSELYLISGDGKTRNLFRWKVKPDSDSLNQDCSYSDPKTPTGTGCLGTIQFLKLQGRDYGLDHVIGTNDQGEYDGVIDTWLYDKSFDEQEGLAGSGSEDKWVNLFPDTINITDFQIFPYPNTNIDYAWKDYSESSNISPYIRISFNMLPSLKKRSNIKGSTPKIKIATTINLTNEYSK